MTLAFSEVIALVGFALCMGYALREMHNVHDRMRREIEEERIRKLREEVKDLNEVTPGNVRG